MNRLKILLLSGYLLLALVGGVVYAQSMSNMVLYTEAQFLLPNSVRVASLTIPRFVGMGTAYNLVCNFSFENPSRVAISIEHFEFSLAINNSLLSGSMFDTTRLTQENVGSAGFGLGNLGPTVEPGHNWTTSFVLRADSDSAKEALNHTEQGLYVVIIYNTLFSFRFPGSNLAAVTVYPPWMVEVVSPIG